MSRYIRSDGASRPDLGYATAMLVKPENANPRCTATVDLISKIVRPYLFRVTVIGEPPHAHRREYFIRGPDDNACALKGLELFVKEFSTAAPIRNMAPISRAERQ